MTLSHPLHFTRRFLTAAIAALAMLQSIAAVQAADPTAAGEPLRKRDKAMEIKAAAVLPNGSMLLAGAVGLCVWKDGALTPVKDFPGGIAAAEELKDVTVDSTGRWWVATKDGVFYRTADGQWQESLKGDIHRLFSGADGAVYATLGKGDGVKRTTDGKTWTVVVVAMPEAMRLVPVSK